MAGEDENIRVTVMAENDLKALMDAGRLSNAATLIAAQWFFLNREIVLKRWRSKDR